MRSSPSAPPPPPRFQGLRDDHVLHRKARHRLWRVAELLQPPGHDALEEDVNSRPGVPVTGELIVYVPVVR